MHKRGIRFVVDENGARVTAPISRKGTIDKRQTPQPHLQEVARNTSKLDIASREELFGMVPKGAKTYRVPVTQFKKDRFGVIDHSRPFLYGLSTHTTYGYIARASTEYHSLFTRLSNEHPYSALINKYDRRKGSKK